MTEKICFVIQPFSEPYNKRFKNIYKPAIEYAGLIPYRAGGPSTEIITNDIENGIRNAHICFADITEDNPNVLYEVGFAYACGKSVVMVCNKTVRSAKQLPFDISVKNVIFYKDVVDSSQSDHDSFVQNIIEQIRARARKIDSDNTVSPVTEKRPQNSDNPLTPLESELLRRIEEVKKIDSDNTVSPVTEQQPKNSDNLLTSLEGKVLERIVLSFLEDGHFKNSEEIVNEFYSERKERVLFSLNKIKLEGYIEEVTNAWDGVVRYRPTEKGSRWCDENIHNQSTHSTSSDNDLTG